MQGLWEGVLGLVRMAWFNGDGGKAEEEGEEGNGVEGRWGMRKVLNVDLGRR